MSEIEKKIVALLAKNDPYAISLLYDHYADTLYGIIKMIVKEEHIAKDVLQESFVKFWKKGKTYNPQKAKLFTWLLQIAKNTAIDKQRSLKSRGNKEIYQADFNINNSGYVELHPQLLDISQHVASLEFKYRSVIQALFFNGQTQKEASETLNIPLGTVKTRLKRGLSQLKSIFAEKECAIITLITLLI